MITDSLALLPHYVAEGSESAFTELVGQQIALVYSAALRQVGGDAALAQDVTQAVLTDLARKAPRLTRHTSLTAGCTPARATWPGMRAGPRNAVLPANNKPTP